MYDSLTKTEPETMIEAMSRVAKYVKLEEDQRLERKEKLRTSKKGKSVIKVAEPRVTLRPRQAIVNSRGTQHRDADSECDLFKFYSLSITPNGQAFGKQDYLRWPKKMVLDPSTRDNKKLYAFHNDYEHFTM